MTKNKLLTLFVSFFKIGLFTFGGGYAMIALLEREFVERRKWLTHDEFLDIVAVAESTPGPIAINSATYIGYKIGRVQGSLLSTLAVCIPSFTIIFTISLFFDAFLQIKYVDYAFHGIQACVCYLILSAGIKMFLKIKRTTLSVTLFILTILALLSFTVFSIKFSSIFLILIGAAVGLIFYLIRLISGKEAKK